MVKIIAFLKCAALFPSHLYVNTIYQTWA